MTISSKLASRIRLPSIMSKVMPAEATVPFFKNGDYVGWSGFTAVGSPKVVPKAIAKHVRDNNLQGQMRFELYVGASATAPIEDEWAELDMIHRRSPHQVARQVNKNINNGKTLFFDKHLSMWSQDLSYGFYTLNRPDGRNVIDTAIIEATAITEDGQLIPGASVGASPELMEMADKIIIEVNTAIPSLEGLHDIYDIGLPPHRKPIPITSVEQRIGTVGIPFDPSKVVAIVESTVPDITGSVAEPDAVSKGIASNLIEFLHHEVKHGRLPENLLPLQSGIGNIANAVIAGLSDANFKDLTVWTEVLQDSFLDFFDSGSLDFASATSIRLSDECFERFFKGWDDYHKKIILRSQQMSNNPEIIRRLGCIAMNTPVEVDIYAHANSTNVMGSRMLNGLGGSGDFLRNSKYSIMHTPSYRPSKTDPYGISCIVPFSSHIDQTEHDLDVVVTEQGLADVRGLAPRERSRKIIDNCAHPEYRPILHEYVDRAESYCQKRGMLHEPHIIRDAFKMHVNLEDNGTMRLKSWD
ncbi:hypothetical protein CANCADRAFT_28058 [Tortispora caseinolytica NRRL Y-17796]|uniref:Acetyl-CoA hydrolase n=1 Tax=Tortispora caseinolytica NRRL Y-17796 TaxID=767744 RepID=A0A1E4TB33_9ASCO|nr:hypothetical protein CANCADRAFT_28058 [Tortispora caseinolytica NRRL Y-17796]